MEELLNSILEANEAYYLGVETKYTDGQYDQMKRDLSQMASKDPALAAEIGAYDVLEQVGANPEGKSDLNTVKHWYPMYSLDNVYNVEQLTKWSAGKGDLVVSDKKDGSAIELGYQDGKLVRAVTRGNGIIGENVLHSVLLMPNVPKSIDFKTGKVQVTGEVALPLEHFEKVKEIDNYPYKNARNSANGIVRRQSQTASIEYIKFYAYGLKREYEDLDTYVDELAWLAGKGFTTVNYQLVQSIGDLNEAVELMESSRDTNETLIDGAVVRMNSSKQFLAMGSTSKFPRGAIAVKFESVKAEVVIKDVVWTLGLKRKLSPNAIYDPVDLGGITNDVCLLHTKSLMDKLGVKIGCRAVIEKRGDIIPQVYKVVSCENATDVVVPTNCPICDAPLVWKGDYLYCPNDECGNNNKSRIITWTNATDFKGIGPVAASNLGEKYITSIDQFFHLTEDMLIDCGVAPKNATKIVASIEGYKDGIQPQQVLHGLSIDYCGKGTSEDIIVVAGKKISELIGKPESWFLEIKDIGPVTAKSLSLWFCKQSNIDIVNNLYSLGVIKDIVESKVSASGNLNGELICITGTLNKDKKDYHTLIEAAGGQWTDSFKKSITKMVVGDKAGSKEDKARKSGITIWSEQDLVDALNK